MMMKDKTSSKKITINVIALAAIGLTTTFNTSGMIYNESPLALMENISENDMGTTTPFPQMAEVEFQPNYAFAKELFGSGMRDFTKEEAEIYEASLKKIYKPTGVNIFDLC